MVRIATAGDIHCGSHDTTRIREQFAHVHEEADLLLLAGDLTNHGTPEEMRVLANQLRDIPIPVVAVFGNHDVHAEQEAEARRILEDAGVIVLEQEVAHLEIDGVSVGIAGAKGFGGGFRGACASTFGEREMRLFLAPTLEAADFFSSALRSLDTDLCIALMHYAPIPDTLLGERWELFPFLGAQQLGDALDAAGCDLALHGHAHRGTEKGTTPMGVPVRNVAQAVLGAPYRVIPMAPSRRSRRIPTLQIPVSI
ncbi:MAG: metallophosphoesterase [Cyanobacteria bacterium RYN_339]|nr:metallophosphoesterase [Cyanobacteria bacterium RYN_339]